MDIVYTKELMKTPVAYFEKLQSKTAKRAIMLDFFEHGQKEGPHKLFFDGRLKDIKAAKTFSPAYVLGGCPNADVDTTDGFVPNGFICLDFDHVKEYITRLVQCLIDIHHVMACGRSISGDGVYALFYAPGCFLYKSRQECSENAKMIMRLVETFVKLKVSPSISMDRACSDVVTRKRFVTAHEPLIREYVVPFDTNAYLDAFEKSRIYNLASCFDCRPTPSSASTAISLALATAYIGPRAWNRAKNSRSIVYRSHFSGIILGDSGIGKTTMIDAMRIVSSRVDRPIDLCRFGSTSELKNGVIARHTKIDIVDKQKFFQPRIVSDVKSIIEIVDEAYDARESMRNQGFLKTKAAERRRLQDNVYTPEQTGTSKAPEFSFTPSYTSIQISPKAAFAASIAAERTDTGDGRRDLYFEIQPPETPDFASDGDNISIAAKIMNFAASKKDIHFDIGRAVDILNGLKSSENFNINTVKIDDLYKAVSSDSSLSSEICVDDFTEFYTLSLVADREEDCMDARTIIPTIALIESYMAGRYSILAEDFYTAAAIAKSSFKIRAELRQIAGDNACEPSISKAESYFSARGGKSSLSAWHRYRSRALAGRREIADWERLNTVEYSECGKKYIRLCTEQEIASKSEQEAFLDGIKKEAFSMYQTGVVSFEKTQNQSWERARRPEFKDDSADCKKIRVLEFVSKTIQNRRVPALEDGSRNACLHALKRSLCAAKMWCDDSFLVLRDLGIKAGLKDDEIARVLREEDKYK